MRSASHGLIDFELPLCLTAREERVDLALSLPVRSRRLHFPLLLLRHLIANLGLLLLKPSHYLREGALGISPVDDETARVLDKEKNTFMRE